MTDFHRRFGQWAMVAGSAEGIGAAFCRELASMGMNLIMVDTNREGMELLGSELESRYSVLSQRLVLDLAEETAGAACMEAVKETGCRLMVYNAAYSRVKPFLAAAPEELDQYIGVNVGTPLKCAYHFAAYLKQTGQTGGILLMSSLAGLWGTRLVAAYSGTKAFSLLLAEALSYELSELGISVGACCAGATATPGYLGTEPRYGWPRPTVMDPGSVASYALKQLGRKTLIIPGFSNRMTYFLLTRIMPRRLAASLVNKTMARTYGHHMR